MFPFSKKLVSLSLILSICGCSLTPGGHIESSSPVKNAFFEEEPEINAIKITPELIRGLELQEPSAKINLELSNKIDDYSYRIGKGDILNITVWDHPELTIPAGQYRSAGESGSLVHSDGYIFYPYIGKVHVLNMRVDEVRDLLAKLLSRYIESPQIDVSVALYKSQRVFVTGAVKLPSVLHINNTPMTLLDALNLAGGLSEGADWRSVVLTSHVNSEQTKREILNLYALYQKGDMSQNRLLKSHDIVHVPRNDFLKVFVMGDVLDVATQRIDQSGLTLTEALNNAGGINEATADASGIFVLRASDNEDSLVDVFQLDASSGAMLILGTKFNLKPMDIVYVTSAPVARWNRIISQLIPTFNLLRYANQADINLD